PRRRRPSWLLMGLAAAATTAAVAVPTVVLSGHQGLPLPPGARPGKVTGALNMLVVGTDVVAGSPLRRKGVRADTILLVHLPADREEIRLVNLPRKSIVQIPACGSRPARKDMIGSAFDGGGLTCSVKTVETLTGVRIDHAMELRLDAVKGMVDALGGVEVRLPRPVDDKAAKLALPAGRNLLDGERALGYARLRDHGDGADLQRFERHQALMSGMLKKARSLLTDPGKIRDFLSAVARTTRTDMDLDTMAGIAMTASHSRPRFATVPSTPTPEDPGKVVWKQPEASRLFQTLE
ncbi:LCP family protein, partial [Nonomuraea lactucae]|uniref:LCP family protein n=1 Tax=Nonomuraea lactucae TaxID=2249762 RepID=UPI001962AFD1